MSDDVLLTWEEPGIAVISFNRPHRHNAFTDASDRQFFGHLRTVRDRDDVRCVVLRGNGPSFSSGRDTAELGQRPDGVSDHDYIAAGHAGTRVLVDLPCPTIAALHGWVLGGSFERALLCDIRVAATSARMALPEVGHGVIPDSAGVARLFQMAGHGVALDLALTGRVMDADEALSHGIVSRVVADDDLEATVMEMAALIASRPRLAVELAKLTVSRLATPAVLATLDLERLGQSTVMASPDFRARAH
jgi:enoyl-CoA hydratase/carnithine racemase